MEDAGAAARGIYYKNKLAGGERGGAACGKAPKKLWNSGASKIDAPRPVLPRDFSCLLQATVIKTGDHDSHDQMQIASLISLRRIIFFNSSLTKFPKGTLLVRLKKADNLERNHI